MVLHCEDNTSGSYKRGRGLGRGSRDDALF